MDTGTLERADYELRYQSLFDPGRALAFPCDADGRVDMDTLPSPALNNYLYARAFVGREFFAPAVQRADTERGSRQARPTAPTRLLFAA